MSTVVLLCHFIDTLTQLFSVVRGTCVSYNSLIQLFLYVTFFVNAFCLSVFQLDNFAPGLF